MCLGHIRHSVSGTSFENIGSGVADQGFEGGWMMANARAAFSMYASRRFICGS